MIKTKAKGWGSGGWGGDPDSEWKEHGGGGGQGHGGGQGYGGGFNRGWGGVIGDPYFGYGWNPYETVFLESDDEKKKRLKKQLEDLENRKVSNSLGNIII